MMTRRELRIMTRSILKSICDDFKLKCPNIKIKIKSIDRCIYGQFAYNEETKHIILNNRLMNVKEFKNIDVYNTTIENVIIHEVLHYIQYRLSIEIGHTDWFNMEYFKRIKSFSF